MESQSRYSIVANLTKQKLDILDEKAEVNNEIKEIEQDIEQKRNSLKNWEEDVIEDTKREKRKRITKIDSLTSNLSYKKEQISAQIENYDNKLNELNKALSYIEEISKVAPLPQEQN